MLQTLSLKLGDVGRVPQLLRFIGRAEKLKPPIQAAFVFGQRGPLLKFMPSDRFEFSTRNHDPFDLLALIVLLCLALSPLLPHVERLDFHCDQRSPSSQGLVDPEHWLEIFRPFIAVQSLRVPKKVWSRVGPALQALAEEGATEVSPELRTLFLKEPFEEDKKSIESLIPRAGSPSKSNHTPTRTLMPGVNTLSFVRLAMAITWSINVRDMENETTYHGRLLGLNRPNHSLYGIPICIRYFMT
jgi:hypothetical protein